MSSSQTSTGFATAEITIESLGGLGDGIATLNGKPIFVSKTCVGDTLRVRIVEQKSDHARGEIAEIITPGADRVEATCSHYAECGGCSLMHFSADSYQQFKRRNLQSALRQAGFAEQPFDMVFLDADKRRRAEFKIAHTPRGIAMAYYRQRSHDLVPIERCHILDPNLQKLATQLAAALSEFPHTDKITHASITAADSGLDLLLTMPEWDKEWAPQFKSMSKKLGFARISAILPEGQIIDISELSAVTMQLGNYKIALPPNTFLQATSDGQKLLTEHVVKAITKGDAVVDLFSGIGTYSFPLLDIASNVHALEGEAVMVKSIEKSIKQHELGEKLTTKQRDLFKWPLLTADLNRFHSAVINPPRIGAKKQCEELAKSKVGTVIMVSCNPATWARDAKTLKEGGFSLTSVTGINQFVYSSHLEIVSVFKR